MSYSFIYFDQISQINYLYNVTNIKYVFNQLECSLFEIYRIVKLFDKNIHKLIFLKKTS